MTTVGVTSAGVTTGITAWGSRCLQLCQGDLHGLLGAVPQDLDGHGGTDPLAGEGDGERLGRGGGLPRHGDDDVTGTDPRLLGGPALDHLDDAGPGGLAL